MDKVEIKQKKGTNSDEVQNTFAFVTIGIDEYKLRQCLQEFKEQQFRGRYLQVTVARENFLEKLKREREEAAQHKTKKDESNEIQMETVKAVLPIISTGNSSSSESSSSDDSSEDESPPTQSKPIARQNGSKKLKSSSESSESDSDSNENEDNLVLRKKSKIFLENGKVNFSFLMFHETLFSISFHSAFRSRSTVLFPVVKPFTSLNQKQKRQPKKNWMKSPKKRTRNDLIR